MFCWADSTSLSLTGPSGFYILFSAIPCIVLDIFSKNLSRKGHVDRFLGPAVILLRSPAVIPAYTIVHIFQIFSSEHLATGFLQLVQGSALHFVEFPLQCFVFDTLISRGRCRRLESCSGRAQAVLPARPSSIPPTYWERLLCGMPTTDNRIALRMEAINSKSVRLLIDSDRQNGVRRSVDAQRPTNSQWEASIQGLQRFKAGILRKYSRN